MRVSRRYVNSSGAKAAFQTVSKSLRTRMFPGMAGFLLPHTGSLQALRHPHKVGTSAGISTYQRCRYRGCRCKTRRMNLPSGPGRLRLAPEPSPPVITAPTAPIGTAPTGKDGAPLHRKAAGGCTCIPTPNDAESRATGSCLPACRPTGRSCRGIWSQPRTPARPFTQRQWNPPAPGPGGTGWFGHPPVAGAGRRTGGAGRRRG